MIIKTGLQILAGWFLCLYSYLQILIDSRADTRGRANERIFFTNLHLTTLKTT